MMGIPTGRTIRVIGAKQDERAAFWETYGPTGDASARAIAPWQRS